MKLRALALAALLLAPASARADDVRAQCSSAYSEAQVMKKNAQLVAAREKLLVCAQEACAGFIKSDCAQWLQEVDARLPEIVLAARDAAGADVTKVRVEIDGKPFAPSLTGKAQSIDPGTHKLRFEAPGAAPVEQALLVNEGEKGRVVLLHVGGAPVTAPAAEPPRARASAVPALVVGGIGVASIAASIVFGLSAQSDVDHMKSTCAPSCAHDDIRSADTKIIVSDVTLAVGVVAVGVAAWLFFSRPQAPAPTAALLTF